MIAFNIVSNLVGGSQHFFYPGQDPDPYRLKKDQKVYFCSFAKDNSFQWTKNLKFQNIPNLFCSIMKTCTGTVQFTKNIKTLKKEVFTIFGGENCWTIFIIQIFCIRILFFQNFKKGTAPTRSGSAALVQVLLTLQRHVSSRNTVFVYKTAW